MEKWGLHGQETTEWHDFQGNFKSLVAVEFHKLFKGGSVWSSESKKGFELSMLKKEEQYSF